MFRLYIMFCFFCLNSIFILLYSNDSIFSQILILNLLVITLGMAYSLNKKFISIDLLYWIFNYLFFVFAPCIQVTNGHFPNTFPIDMYLIYKGQSLILIWNSIFLVLKYALDRKYFKRDLTEEIGFRANTIVANIYFLLALIIFVFILTRYGVNFFLGYVKDNTYSDNKTLNLLANAFITGVIYSNFIFQYRIKEIKNTKYNLKCILSVLMLIYIVSPFNTTRYITAFVILFFIWLFHRRKFKPAGFSIFFVIGVFFVFPFLDNFMKAGFTTDINVEVLHAITKQFEELHFDAFANFLATMSYVEQNNSLLGLNLLGSILFFIPRAIWSGKPISSGELVGDYLTDVYYLNFNNLSNPLVSEFYLAFGFIGILIGAIIFTIFISKLERALLIIGKDYDLLYGITLGIIFIILRGDLMISMSSYIAFIIFMIVIPKLIAFCIK